jgi:hypothetical protein
MAVLSKLWIAYIHFSDSSKKDDYLISFARRVISEFGTGKQGSGPQKLDLDPTPAIPSASSFSIIPQ